MDGFEPGEEGGKAGVVLVGCEKHLVVEVGPGCGCCEGFQGDGAEAEGGDYVLTDGRGGGCGEADDRD